MNLLFVHLGNSDCFSLSFDDPLVLLTLNDCFVLNFYFSLHLSISMLQEQTLFVIFLTWYLNWHWKQFFFTKFVFLVLIIRLSIEYSLKLLVHIRNCLLSFPLFLFFIQFLWLNCFKLETFDLSMNSKLPTFLFFNSLVQQPF